jgi:hypothetical protein
MNTLLGFSPARRAVAYFLLTVLVLALLRDSALVCVVRAPLDVQGLCWR